MNYIAFDFDGTIADSRFAICEAMERACIRQGVSYIGDDELSQHIGVTLYELVPYATRDELSDELVDEVVRSYRETFRDNLVTIFDGMRRLLELCHDTGDKIAIASARSSHSLNMLIEQLEIKELLSAVVGGDEVFEHKPNPEMLWRVATELGCSPRELIVVGDTSWDMEMAKNTGAFGVGVTWGSHDELTLRCAGADMIFSTPVALANYFNFAAV